MKNVIRELQAEIGAANKANGFHERGEKLREEVEWKTREGYDAEDAVGALRDYQTSRLSLITTEVAEAIEELRNGDGVNETYYTEPGGTYGSSYGFRRVGSLRKPEGVPSELADIVIRTFDFADEFEIDLAEMIEEKLAYNATRGHKHGKKF